MSRSRRMGVFNALDELLPGPPPGDERPRLEPVPDGSASTWDDLLPGPRSPRPRLTAVPAGLPARPPGRRKALAHNPLDELAPDPAVKVRANVRVAADVMESVRDAVAYLKEASGDRSTLSELTEQALREEVHRLARTHNRGRPFPPRDPT